jgi:hypothetical protein
MDSWTMFIIVCAHIVIYDFVIYSNILYLLWYLHLSPHGWNFNDYNFKKNSNPSLLLLNIIILLLKLRYYFFFLIAFIKDTYHEDIIVCAMLEATSVS